MKKRYLTLAKKSLAVFMAALFVGMLAPAAIAANAEKNFIIENPYEEINWDEWEAYKTQLHCHTTASDGFLTIDEFCKMHYAADYDIVALTDHGTLNRGWNVAPEVVPIMRAIKKERTKNAPIVPISDEEYEAYINGTNENRTR